MPKPFPTEFRRDVIAVARQGDPVDRASRPEFRGLGVLPVTLAAPRRPRGRHRTWRSAPAGPTTSATDLEAENRELRRRTKQLEQENEILRRATAYFARDVLPK